MGSAARAAHRRQPVFGQVIRTEPIPDKIADIFTGSSRMIASPKTTSSQRPRSQFLHEILVPQKGSFQRLKEIIRSERANELEQQRRNEDIAVRAALLKEMSKGHGYIRRPMQLKHGMMVGEYDRAYNKPLLRYPRERNMPNKRTIPLINMLSTLEESNINGNKIDMNHDDIVNSERGAVEEENYDNIDYDNKNKKNNNNENNADKFNYNDNDSSSEISAESSSYLYKGIPQISKTRNFNGIALPIMNTRQHENQHKSSLFYGIGDGGGGVGRGNGFRSYFDDRNGYIMDLDDGDD